MKFPRLPEWCLRLGIVYLLIGMGFGAYMGAHEDFKFRDVHAHFNLLGFVSTFLIGLYLKAYPAALKSRLAVGSVVLILISVPLTMVLLTFFYMDHPAAGAALGPASGFVLVSYVLFAVSLFRTTSRS